MKKIIMVGSDDMSNLFSMLVALKKIHGKEWGITFHDQNVIHIVENVNENQIEKFLVINIDMDSQIDLGEYVGYTVITVGFNSKASITVSSVANEEIVFCIQREIFTRNYEVEPQEFVFNRDFFGTEDILNTIFTFTCLLLLQEKDIEKSLLKTCFQE